MDKGIWFPKLGSMSLNNVTHSACKDNSRKLNVPLTRTCTNSISLSRYIIFAV